MRRRRARESRLSRYHGARIDEGKQIILDISAFGIRRIRDRQSGQEPRHLPYAATAFAFRPLFRSAFRLKVVAPERIPSEGSLVVVANHESNLDGLVLMSTFTERRLTFLTAAHLFERPAIGRFLRGIGALPVEEECANVSSLKRALVILAGGGTVAVFPQGGIAREELQGGAAYLALKANAALLPLHLAGTRKALPPDGRACRRKSSRRSICNPIQRPS